MSWTLAPWPREVRLWAALGATVVAAVAVAAYVVFVHRSLTHTPRRRPILLVLDDLDRCSAERAVELLETVHTLLRPRREPQVFNRWRVPAALLVLVVADGRWVRTAFETAYKDFRNLGSDVHGLGADFLQKLFDHTVLVPQLSANQVQRMVWATTGTPSGPGADPTDTTALAPTTGRPATPLVRPSDRLPSDAEGRLEPSVDQPQTLASLASVGDTTRQTHEEQSVQRAETEATDERIEERAKHLLSREDYIGLLPANPRLVRRVANTWGMLQVIKDHVQHDEKTDTMVRAAIMFVRMPTLVDELLSAPGPPATHAPLAAPESPWLRADVQQLLTRTEESEDGDPPGAAVPITSIARCFGREFPTVTRLSTHRSPAKAHGEHLPAGASLNGDSASSEAATVVERTSKEGRTPG